MKVLVACEESQTVCKAFRAKGHEAYSCDIQEPSGGHPEWHILGDALKAIKGGQVTTMDGQVHVIPRFGWEDNNQASAEDIQRMKQFARATAFDEGLEQEG